MAYEFTKLGNVVAVDSPSDAANVLIEEDGVIKRAPKTSVGEVSTDTIGILKYDKNNPPAGVGKDGVSVCVVAKYDADKEGLTVNGETPTVEQWIEWAKAVTPIVVIGAPDGNETHAGSATWSIYKGCGVVKLFVYNGSHSTAATTLTTEQYNEIKAAWDAM